jgi:hypothetical protein
MVGAQAKVVTVDLRRGKGSTKIKRIQAGNAASLMQDDAVTDHIVSMN